MRKLGSVELFEVVNAERDGEERKDRVAKGLLC